MIQAQENFGDSLTAGRNECNTYVNDMTALRNSLTGDFKNLAFLQVPNRCMIRAIRCVLIFSFTFYPLSTGN